jgi:hypothetical protein
MRCIRSGASTLSIFKRVESYGESAALAYNDIFGMFYTSNVPTASSGCDGDLTPNHTNNAAKEISGPGIRQFFSS